MESSKKVACENTSCNINSEHHYYCFKCKEILCQECLIIHLCSSVHEQSSIKKIEEAITEGKALFTSVKDQLQTINLDPLSLSGDTQIDKLLAQKEMEYAKLMDTMQFQFLDVFSNINKLFALLRKKDAQVTNEDYKKNIDVLKGELEKIEANWEQCDTIERLNHLKAISNYEKRAQEIMNRFKNKETKLLYKKYKERGAKEIGAMIEEIGLAAFGNWHRKQWDAIKQKINNQVIQIEKYFDDFPFDYEAQKRIDGLTSANGTISSHNNTTTISNISPTFKPIEHSDIIINKNECRIDYSNTQLQPSYANNINYNLRSNQKQNNNQKESMNQQDIEMTQDQAFQFQTTTSNQAKTQYTEEKPIKINQISLTPSKAYPEFPYKGNCIFALRKKDPFTQVEVICYIKKQIVTTQLSMIEFQQYSSQFPFKNCKSINLGNALMITGGGIDSTITNKTYVLQFNDKNQIVLAKFVPMIYNREGHNILYIQKTNTVIVCGGQLNMTAEKIELNEPEKGWKELPQLNCMRANATLILLNEKMIYCIGGFNNETNEYVNGYECLCLNDTSKEWKNVKVNEEISICTMGFVQFDKSSALLFGGFAGGKKYLQDGFWFGIDAGKGKDEEGEDSYTNVKIDKRDQVLNKSIIFYSSPQFFLINDEIVNFDFKQGLIVFNPITEKARVI